MDNKEIIFRKGRANNVDFVYGLNKVVAGESPVTTKYYWQPAEVLSTYSEVMSEIYCDTLQCRAVVFFCSEATASKNFYFRNADNSQTLGIELITILTELPAPSEDYLGTVVRTPSGHFVLSTSETPDVCTKDSTHTVTQTVFFPDSVISLWPDAFVALKCGSNSVNIDILSCSPNKSPSEAGEFTVSLRCDGGGTIDRITCEVLE